jgi:hypothetical protein
MNKVVRDCLVTGHKKLIATLCLPDPEERAADSSLEKNQQLRIKFIAKLA